MRVIADHLRAMTFLIADGVLPSNEWRGYVLRKIMRRAMRHGKKLGFTEPFLHTLVDVVVGEMGDAYPELATGRDAIVADGARRGRPLRCGADIGPAEARGPDRADGGIGSKAVPGDEVFRLYDSLGVPLDFAEDLAGQRGLTIDRDGLRRGDGGPARARARGEQVRRRRAVERSRCASIARARTSSRATTATTEPDVEVAVHGRTSRSARPCCVWLDGRRSTSSPAARCRTPGR